jgi:hypothetical protein
MVRGLDAIMPIRTGTTMKKRSFAESFEIKSLSPQAYL